MHTFLFFLSLCPLVYGTSTATNTTVIYATNTTVIYDTNTYNVSNTTQSPQSTKCSAKIRLKSVKEGWAMTHSITEFNLSQMCDELKESEKWKNPQSTSLMAVLLLLKGVLWMLLKAIIIMSQSRPSKDAGDQESSNTENREVEEICGPFAPCVANCCCIDCAGKGMCGYTLTELLVWPLEQFEQLSFTAVVIYGLGSSLVAIHNQGIGKTSGGPDGVTWNQFFVMFGGLIEFQPFFIGLVEFILRVIQKVSFTLIDQDQTICKLFWDNPVENLGLAVGCLFYFFYFLLMQVWLIIALLSSLLFPGLFIGICVFLCLLLMQLLVGYVCMCVMQLPRCCCEDIIVDKISRIRNIRGVYLGLLTFFVAIDVGLVIAVLSPFLCFGNHPFFALERMQICFLMVCRDALYLPGMGWGLHFLFEPEIEIVLLWCNVGFRFLTTCIRGISHGCGAAEATASV